LLHAAGQFVGKLVLGSFKSHQRKEITCSRAALRHWKAENFCWQENVVEHASPFQQEGLLKHHANVA
jgi:hypothetical protein